MARRRWVLGSVGVIAAALFVSSIDRPAPPSPGTAPLYAEIHTALVDAYDVTKWSLRVPVEWAAPRVVEAGLQAWVATLSLDPAVRARVDARLDGTGLVDELVPFALFVKRMYQRPDVSDFATWARGNVRPKSGVPGYEHSLFSFTPPVESAGGAPPLDRAADLIAFYDAVWLQDAPTGGDAVRCGSDGLEERARRGKASIHRLLSEVRTSMEPGDMKDAVGHVLADDTTLEAITLSLVEFVDGEVCKHYRIFATELQRQHQLESWLGDALADPERPDGWAWLRWHGSRRHAVHVVVDGLQGHLVDSLARGAPHDPFLTWLSAEDAQQKAARPKFASTSAGPSMRTEFLQHAVENGTEDLLPYLAGVVTSPGFAEQGLSTTPTISVRNLPIAMTGAPVAGPNSTGIPNFHFVDRDYELDGVVQGRPWYFYGNDALQLTALTSAAGMRTMFSRFERLVTMSCGGQYDELASYSFDGFLSLAVGETSRDFGDVRCVGELQKRAANERRMAAIRASIFEREGVLRTRHHPWEWYDIWAQNKEAQAVQALVVELAALEPQGMPDYLLYYNAWPDHFAHGKGPFSDEIIGPTGELVRLDHWLAALSNTYEAAGLTSRTLFGMAGDHGLSPVHWIVSPEAEVLTGLERDGIELVVKKISSDEGEGPKLTHRFRPPSMKGIDVVVASTAGGNYMMDFFVDQDANWGRQPVLSELRQLRTLAGRQVDIVGEILDRLGGSLDYLVVRETACTPDGGTTAVMRGKDIGHLERRGDRIWYGWEGADLLGLEDVAAFEAPDPEIAASRARCAAARREDVTTWCTETEWRSLTRVNVRPDAVSQLAHLYDTDRAGTVNLFPRAGVGYNTKVPGRHAGESFHEKDAFVGVWGAPVTRGRVPVAVNGAVPMALHAWVTGVPAVEGTDGWGYPDVLSGVVGR